MAEVPLQAGPAVCALTFYQDYSVAELNYLMERYADELPVVCAPYSESQPELQLEAPGLPRFSLDDSE